MSSEDKSQENQQEDFVAPSDVDAESILEGVLEDAESEANSKCLANFFKSLLYCLKAVVTFLC